MEKSHEYFMQKAIDEAEKAKAKKEIPIGAIIVENNTIIAKGYNQVETLNDCTAHAEIIALTSAFCHRNTKFLPECSIYITLEPCYMCAYAINLAKIKNIYFGLSRKKGPIPTHILYHSKTNFYEGIFKKNCEKLIKEFFLELRIS